MRNKTEATSAREPVPEGKVASRPFWDKYLTLLDQGEQQIKRRQTPLQERLRSLDVLIRNFEAESRDATELINERQRVLDIQERHIDEADLPAIHPDAKGELALLGFDDDDELAIRVLNSHYVKKVPQKGSVKREAEKYVATKIPDVRKWLHLWTRQGA